MELNSQPLLAYTSPEMASSLSRQVVLDCKNRTLQGRKPLYHLQAWGGEGKADDTLLPQRAQCDLGFQGIQVHQPRGPCPKSEGPTPGSDQSTHSQLAMLRIHIFSGNLPPL